MNRQPLHHAPRATLPAAKGRSLAYSVSRENARRQFQMSLLLIAVLAGGTAFAGLQTLLTVLR